MGGRVGGSVDSGGVFSFYMRRRGEVVAKGAVSKVRRKAQGAPAGNPSGEYSRATTSLNCW